MSGEGDKMACWSEELGKREEKGGREAGREVQGRRLVVGG